MTFSENAIANFWIMLRRSSFWTTMIAFATAWVTMDPATQAAWLEQHGLGFLSDYLFPLLLLAVIVAFIFPQIGVTNEVLDQAVANDKSRRIDGPAN